MTMTQAKLNEVLRLHALWLLDDESGKKADLSCADLSYADLSSADLSSANLSSADLRSADLHFADLSYADLRYANLRYANLSHANLRSADLSHGVRIMSVSGVGPAHRMTTFRADTDEVWCGCFKGTLAQFAKKTETAHRKNAQHRSDYRAVVAMFKAFAVKLENE